MSKTKPWSWVGRLLVMAVSKMNAENMSNQGFLTAVLVSIISNLAYLSNALTNPWAMVIKFMHAVVANRAMRSTGWTIQHACFTVFYFDSKTIHDFILRSSSRQLQLWGSSVDPFHRWSVDINWFICSWWPCVSWHDTWVYARCHEEKHQILNCRW